MSPVVDVHSHLFSPSLVEAIHSDTPFATEVDNDAGRISNFLGLSLPLQTEEARAHEGRELGVDVQVLSVRTSALFPPDVLSRTPKDRAQLARVVNTHLSNVIGQHDGFFRAFADVPLFADETALGTAEIVQALDRDGLQGVMLYTNYDGQYLDGPQFTEMFEELDRRSATVFLHPTVVRGAPGVSDNRMYSMVGFPFDTTLCIARMAYGGFFDRHTSLNLIASHAGGAIPFLWWRLGLGYRQNYLDIQSRLDKDIEDYLSSIYYDTALVDNAALDMANARFGHRLVFGTDHPYSPNGIARTLETINKMNVDEEQKAAILGGTASILLRL